MIEKELKKMIGQSCSRGRRDGQDVEVLESAFLCRRTTDMKHGNNSGLLKGTPWTDTETVSPLRSFIDTTNTSNYERRHPALGAVGEV